jgi:hypothetical protein
MLAINGAFPRVEHLKGASFGKALALPANIGLGLKGTNTLAYDENSSVKAVKRFTT